MIKVSADLLTAQLTSVLQAWGMKHDHARICTEVMVDTDLRGIDSHGVGMLSAYEEWRRDGQINMTPNIRVIRDQPGLCAIDADNSLGHPPAVMAMEMAIEKAQSQGVGVAVVGRSNHYGAAGYYAQMAAEKGLVGLSMSSTPKPLMVPTFGKQTRLGSNPLAFAAPVQNGTPVVVDMATTTVAFGKVTIARRAGKSLPKGWALDEEGEALTDPERAWESRAITPLGGERTLGSHKGYGLAVMVEVLSSVLIGALIAGHIPETGELSDTLNIGHFFLAIDPQAARGDSHAFGIDMGYLVNFLRSTVPIDPAQPVLVPGDPEHESLVRRLAEGIPMLPALVGEVRDVCERAKVPFLL
ncbi:MAG: Ldh family oxidoreductase [Alphaproteobacteria bacterium]